MKLVYVGMLFLISVLERSKSEYSIFKLGILSASILLNS